MGIKNDKIKSHIKTQLANDRKCDKIINLCWHLPPCDATCNVKDIFIWSICIICVNPQRDLWGRGIWESLPGAWNITGLSLVHFSKGAFLLEERVLQLSTSSDIRRQAWGGARPSTVLTHPGQASSAGEITVNYLIAWSWFQNIQTMNIFRT